MFGLIIQFAVILLLAKSISSSFQYYKAALAYFIFILVLGMFVVSKEGFMAVFLASAIKGAVALPYFYLLDRFEDTIFTWLIIFAVGFFILVAV